MVKFCLEDDWNNSYEKKEILQSQYNALKEDGFMADKLMDTKQHRTIWAKFICGY